MCEIIPQYTLYQKYITALPQLRYSVKLVKEKGKKENKTQIQHYVVKDGYISYNVYLYPIPICQCTQDKQKYCYHILFILTTIFKLTQNSIRYLDKFASEFQRCYKDSLSFPENIGKNFNSLVLDNILNDKCGICVSELNNQKLYECKYCRKLAHYKCIANWISQLKPCIYCKL